MFPRICGSVGGWGRGHKQPFQKAGETTSLWERGCHGGGQHQLTLGSGRRQVRSGGGAEWWWQGAGPLLQLPCGPSHANLSLWAAACGWASLLQSSVGSHSWMEVEGIPSSDSFSQSPGRFAVFLYRRAECCSHLLVPQRSGTPALFGVVLGFGPLCPSQPWSEGRTNTGIPESSPAVRSGLWGS